MRFYDGDRELDKWGDLVASNLKAADRGDDLPVEDRGSVGVHELAELLDMSPCWVQTLTELGVLVKVGRDKYPPARNRSRYLALLRMEALAGEKLVTLDGQREPRASLFNPRPELRNEKPRTATTAQGALERPSRLRVGRCRRITKYRLTAPGGELRVLGNTVA